MATAAIKFFEDNISRLPRPASAGATPESDREYNLNSGLAALAKEVHNLRSEQQQTQQLLQQLATAVSRSR